jgi:hypothetical protein
MSSSNVEHGCVRASEELQRESCWCFCLVDAGMHLAQLTE